MWISNVSEQDTVNTAPERTSISEMKMFRSAADTVKRAIIKNPGAALLFSAGIGIILACLIKRR